MINVCTYSYLFSIHSGVYWLSSCLRRRRDEETGPAAGPAGARELEALRIARELPAVRLLATRRDCKQLPAAETRLVAHRSLPARRLLRRRHPRAR